MNYEFITGKMDRFCQQINQTKAQVKITINYHWSEL